jgi:SNF2 family DNA or RNA helicase
VYTINRKNREAFIRAIDRRVADTYLMHWDALRLLPDLTRMHFNLVIADEVQRAANRKAQAARALKKIPTEYKLGLSGTASGDKPQNLWSVLNWLWPTYYRSFWKFFKHYVVTEIPYGQSYQKVIGVQNVESLKREMSPWYSRHLKRERCCPHHPNGVMAWLLDKTYETIWVDLSPKQRKIYDQMKKRMVAWVGEHEDSPLVASVVVSQMVRLNQIALATPEVEMVTVDVTREVWDRRTGMKVKKKVQEERQKVTLHLPSSKIDKVKERITDNEGKQFVVFSSSKKACYLAAEAFAKAGITSEVLSGDTPQSQRQGMIARFVEGKFQVFIGVIAAAAEGVDGLQLATDTAIFLDRHPSAVKSKQAEDRLDRDLQKNSVQIIDTVARNTLDMGRRTKLEEKWTWIKKILGDGFDNELYVKTGFESEGEFLQAAAMHDAVAMFNITGGQVGAIVMDRGEE